MAMRKIKGKTVYPPPEIRTKIEGIATGDPDGATFNYYAVKFMRWGLARYERRQAKRHEQRKLQPS